MAAGLCPRRSLCRDCSFLCPPDCGPQACWLLSRTCRPIPGHCHCLVLHICVLLVASPRWAGSYRDSTWLAWSQKLLRPPALLQGPAQAGGTGDAQTSPDEGNEGSEPPGDPALLLPRPGRVHPRWQEVEAQPAPQSPTLPSSLQRLTLTLVLAALSAALGSAFQYGYNIAVVNTPHQVGATGLGGRRLPSSPGIPWVPMLETKGTLAAPERQPLWARGDANRDPDSLPSSLGP